jgi:hypothetical protein
MAQRRSKGSDSPTLPLPPPKSRLSFEEFVEAATAAALRAAQAEQLDRRQPTRPVPIWIGIILDPWGPGGPLGGGQGGPGGPLGSGQGRAGGR